MADETSPQRNEPKWRVALRATAPLLGFVLLFLAAGTVHWLRGWILVAVTMVQSAVNLLIVRRCNPEILRERLKKPLITEPFDKVFYPAVILSAPIMMTLAGLDARYHWSSMSFMWVYIGLAMLVVGDIPVMWSLCVNPFLVTTMRIQSERGQRVITTGPYRFVRHPMYAGGIVMYLGWPLILGSIWALVIVAVIAVGFVARTALEDRMLRDRLEGYEEYCRQTRYRLIPGVW